MVQFIKRPGRFPIGGFVLFLIIGSLTCSSPDTEISDEELRSYVEFLASDELEGRMVGTSGCTRAEQYIAGEFKDIGLKPLPGEEDFFIDFTLYRRGYEEEKTSLEIRIGDERIEAHPGIDFRPFPFSSSGIKKANLVFAGYGITAPEYDYDDYKGLEVTDKFVLVLRHEPAEGPTEDYFEGSAYTDHSLFTKKAENAYLHGAAGMLLTTDPASGRGAEDLRLTETYSLSPYGFGPYSQEKPILAVHISQDFAAKIIEQTGFSLDEIQKALDSGLKPTELILKDAVVELQIERLKEAIPLSAHNLGGIIEGNHPQLKNEWILLGAHHDHIGSFTGEGDTIYNGADDNASGVSGILALARSLSGERASLQRSVVFITFGAEEVGLLGSRALVNMQFIPQRVKYMINLDMIGRNPDKPVQVITEGNAVDLRGIVESANEQSGLKLRFSNSKRSSDSDHYTFGKLGIPFLFFFTGVHEDYHGTEDHAEKLYYYRMKRILDLVREVILLLGSGFEF